MCLAWGINYLFIKVAVRELSVPMLVFLRTGIGALLLVPLAARVGWTAARDVVRRHWLPLLGFAALEIIGPWYLLSDAERHLTSSLAGLIIAAVPIVGVLISRLFPDSEQLSRTRWAGLVIGAVGVVVLAAPAVHGDSALAVGEMLLVVVGYAIAPIIAARKLAEVPNFVMTTVCLGFAALVYTPAAVLTWPTRWPSAEVVASVLVLAVVCTALAFVAFFALIREVGTARAMVFTYINPAVAVAAGVLVLGEPLTATIVASFGLILGGSVLATASSRSGRLRVKQG